MNWLQPGILASNLLEAVSYGVYGSNFVVITHYGMKRIIECSEKKSIMDGGFASFAKKESHLTSLREKGTCRRPCFRERKELVGGYVSEILR